MPQELLNAVIHKIDKVAGSPAVLVTAAACLDIVEEPLRALVDQVHTVYANRESKSYGKFDPTLTALSAETPLRSLKDQISEDFLSTTVDLMRVLKDKADGENFATGGHVLFAESTGGGYRWVIVVILNSKAGAAIDENLRVIHAPHLDVDGIRFAGRVNVTDWASGSAERYISFLRGRKNEVSQYFYRFLGCSTVQQDMVDTRNMVKAVKLFASEQKLDEAAKEELIKSVFRFADGKAATNSPLNLSELANHVWPTEPEALKGVFARADPPVSDGFTPKRRGLDGLTRFSAKAAHWKIEFDRDAIHDEVILFDEDERTLTIKNIPEDVIEHLREEFGSNASD